MFGELSVSRDGDPSDVLESRLGLARLCREIGKLTLVKVAPGRCAHKSEEDVWPSGYACGHVGKAFEAGKNHLAIAEYHYGLLSGVAAIALRAYWKAI
jgi:hypothetical protein